MHRKVAVAFAAALALVAASCGGSETTTLSRAALVRRVELACREAQGATRRQAEAAKGSSDPIAGLLAGQRALADRLETIEASGAARDDFDAFKEGVRSRLGAIEKVAEASKAERTDVLRSVQGEAGVAGRKIATAARRLGLEGCG